MLPKISIQRRGRHKISHNQQTIETCPQMLRGRKLRELRKILSRDRRVDLSIIYPHGSQYEDICLIQLDCFKEDEKEWWYVKESALRSSERGGTQLHL